jgi:sugar phosphate isomerase/epimerase
MTNFTPQRREFLSSASAGAAALALPKASSAGASAPPAASFGLGLVTYNLAATWDLATLLRIADATGIAAVELRTTHGHGVEPTLDAAARQAVKDRFARCKTRLWGLGTVCEFHSPDAKIVEQNIETCALFLKLAADLGARGVKVRPNGFAKGVAEEKTLEQIGLAVRQCGKRAADLGLEVWVEVHGRGTCLPSNMKTIMEVCGHASVGVTWNSNAEDVAGGSVAAALNLLRPWLKSVHINELYGSYPYRELFRLLADFGYNRYTLIEIPQKLEPAPGELLMRYYKALWTQLLPQGP